MPPFWWRWAAMVLAAATLFAAGVASGWYAKDVIAARKLAVIIATHAQEIVAMSEAAMRAEQQARSEEARRQEDGSEKGRRQESRREETCCKESR